MENGAPTGSNDARAVGWLGGILKLANRSVATVFAPLAAQAVMRRGGSVLAGDCRLDAAILVGLLDRD